MRDSAHVRRPDSVRVMQSYPKQTFALPALDGISPAQLAVHLDLYAGYVSNLNKLRDTEADLMQDPERNAYALAEVHRRLAFEFDGMRMHEIYFAQWEGQPAPAVPVGPLAMALAQQFGSYEAWEHQFKALGMMRGIGWTVLYFDAKLQMFINAWVDDHEHGQLTGLPVLLAMDMWEHAYMVDYAPAKKADYIAAFFRNLNWSVAEQRFWTVAGQRFLKVS